MKRSIITLAVGTMLLAAVAPADAKKKEAVALGKCEQSLGTIAVVEGETQGWTEYGLGSPRELIQSLALESGCFTPHSPASGTAADFLMNVVAGDSEEVDKSIEMAKSVAIDGLVRSGAAGSLLTAVPGGGALFGMIGGMGGKKKTVAAGIKLLSPASGQAVATGSGRVTKSSITFGGANAWAAGAAASGYATSKDGKMLVEAFVMAFNSLTAQRSAIASMARPQPVAQVVAAAEPEAPGATVAIDTVMRGGPSAEADSVRTLRAGTSLLPTGRREGLFIEVRDSYGTTGWVSVEDLG